MSQLLWIQVSSGFAEEENGFRKTGTGQGVSTHPAKFSHGANIPAAAETDRPDFAVRAARLPFDTH